MSWTCQVLLFSSPWVRFKCYWYRSCRTFTVSGLHRLAALLYWVDLMDAVNLGALDEYYEYWIGMKNSQQSQHNATQQSHTGSRIQYCLSVQQWSNYHQRQWINPSQSVSWPTSNRMTTKSASADLLHCWWKLTSDSLLLKLPTYVCTIRRVKGEVKLV